MTSCLAFRTSSFPTICLRWTTPFANVTVFYGHIHQAHHHMTGAIAHHAATSLIFPLPAPGSPDHKPMPWDPAQPYRGLGWRQIEAGGSQTQPQFRDVGVSAA